MTTPIALTGTGVRRTVASLLAISTVGLAFGQQTTPPATSGTPKQDEAIVLTPFVVDVSKDKGYYAENTLAGSRIRTNLADLAASITVVTKQQMEDTAALDINDVFKYEANTEGSSTYTPSVTDRGTAKDTLAGYSFGNNGDTTTNAQSNRIRGLSAPDAAINNYSSNSRIPLDSYNTQSIEISRGPNSLLFGLGSASGVVNQNAAQAVLNRNSNSVQLRADQNGSFRGSLSFNRALIEDKLAIFGAILYDDRQFERKPSYDKYRREYAAITYKPFKNTTIRAFAEGYKNDANRPNFLTPRDQVTPWLQSGRPVYDPVTRKVTILDSGKELGPYVTSTLSPGYDPVTNRVLGASALTTIANTNPLFVPGIAFDDISRPLRRIDTSGNSIDYFLRSNVFYRPAQTNPETALPSAATLGWVANDPRFLNADKMWSASTNVPQPIATIDGKNYTYGTYNWAGVTNKSIYDWTKYNTLHTNFATIKAANYNVEFEQQILPNLFFNAGWFRQDIDEVDNYTVNQLQGATLSVDTNKNLMNGSPNPYFGLPYISEGAGGGLDTFRAPETDDNYRALLAYDLDLTKKDGWMKWLGHHKLIGGFAEQDVIKAVERWRDNFVDGDTDGKLRFVQNLTLANQNASLNSAIMRKYYMANPGDPQGIVTHSIGSYGNKGYDAPYASQVEVWNYNNNTYQKDQVVEEGLFSQAGSFRTQRQVVSKQISLQSYLWEDRLITTLGWRHDAYRARITTSGALTDINGKVYEQGFNQDRLYTNGFTGRIDYDRVMNRWTRWDKLDGSTKTLGGVLRPFKDWNFVKNMHEGSIAAEFLQGLSFYYNESDNFNPPATYQTDYFFKPLPKPTGKGKDFGIGFNILKNKLVARINWYETESLNERTSAASTLLTRLIYSDTTTGIPWASAVQRIRNGIASGKTLQQIISVQNWNTDAVNNVSDEANQRKIYELIQLPYRYYDGVSQGATQDSKSKGTELQLTYNPIPNWTMKLTGSKSSASYANVAPQYDLWLAERLPKWTTSAAPEIPDFVDPNGGRRYSLSKFWTGYGYSSVAQIENLDGNTSAEAYFNNVVVSQVALAKALEGANSPLERKYHASFLTNYQFTEGRLKGFSSGGSLRWESKAAIGFYGKVGDPKQPTVINLADVTRPIYDGGNTYADVWFAYSRKIANDKVRMKIQLNINNVNESGRLMPIQVNFDGKPWAYRIIDPRQYVLTTTFDF